MATKVIETSPSTRVCSVCGTEKPLLDYYNDERNKSDGKSAQCKLCTAIRFKQYRLRQTQKGAFGKCKQCEKPFTTSIRRTTGYCRDCAKGENAHNYRGGSMTVHGYWVVRNGTGRQVKEHRLVMEKYLGRKLHSDEYVHHKNGVRHDNRIENLELWVKSQPKGIRIKDAVDWANKILERYT